MNLTKREALEKHKELWLTVAEMSRTEKRCVSKREALLKMGIQPESINSACFCCAYAEQESKKLSRNNVCDYCPVKWPGSIANACAASFFGEWRRALVCDEYEKAAEIAEKIAHLADEPLKEFESMEQKFTKSDLRTGDVIVCRNGFKYIVMIGCDIKTKEPKRFVGIGDTHEWARFNEYNGDLTSIGGFTNLDIVKVLRPKRAHIRPWECKEDEMQVVYERSKVKELTVAEISKLLGYDVKVVK